MQKWYPVCTAPTPLAPWLLRAHHYYLPK